MLENTFPASDPPAWTCGTEPTPLPAQREPKLTEEKATESTSPERGPAQAAGQTPTNPSVSPATPGKEPQERDRTLPGRPFWELSPGERRRFSEQRAGASAGEDLTEAELEDIAETDLVGRQQTSEGPHEPLPGEPRGPEQRAHTGSRGVLLPYQRWTRKELYDRARTLGVKGRSRMSKEELIEAIQSSGAGPRAS